MEFSEQTIILQVGKFKETDLWVRFLSPSKGILSAFAFGGSRSRRRFTGCLDVFNRVLLQVKSAKGGEYLTLSEGVLLDGPVRLRTDWQRYGMAANCVKFMQSFGVAPDSAAKAHFVFLQVLQLLEEADTLPIQLPLLFRARLAFDSGYAVQTDCCAECGAELKGKDAAFGIHEGKVFCRKCITLVHLSGPLIRLGGEALAIMDAMRHADPSCWAELPIASPAGNECARVLDGFIQYHVGLSWENGYFARV